MPQYKQFPLSDTAEGLTEADILDWRVQPGDEVKVNQIVVEIETAKAAVELPIPWAGVVTELLVRPGETVAVGTPILTVDVDPGGAAGAAPAKAAAPAVAEAPAEEEMKPLVGYGSKAGSGKRRARKAAAAAPAAEPAAPPAPAVPAAAVPAPVPQVVPAAPVVSQPMVSQPVVAPLGGTVPLAKPPVRRLAKQLGVDLRTLTASAPTGIISRDDVHQAANGVVAPMPVAPPATAPGRETRVPIKGVRKATAAAMVSSAFTAPHVTEFLTVDVTPMMTLREKLRGSREFAGVKLTPLAFCAKAVCMATRRTPDVNATWDEQAGEIVYKNYVDLGIAAATPRGLIVPKVRDADAMSLRELAVAITELTDVARAGKTAPEDMLNGSITITNVGVFGVDTGTPILNPGESAILAFGSIKDLPWVVDGEIRVRKVCQLALSFDHRVVDGAQGSQYLADVGALLADPATAITY